jgi:hypothetical protein
MFTTTPAEIIRPIGHVACSCEGADIQRLTETLPHMSDAGVLVVVEFVADEPEDGGEKDDC